MKLSFVTVRAWAAGIMLPLLACVQLLAGVQSAAAQDYHVRAGDVLKIEVLEDPSLNRSVLVAPDGKIALPMAGAVQASGKSVSAIADAIATMITPNFAAKPNVYVSLEKLSERGTGGGSGKGATIAIYVMGQVNKPGEYDVKPGTTLLQLLAQSGGFDKFAATKRLQLRRGDTVTTINYDAIEAGSSTVGSTKLQEGDILLVPQRKLFE